MSQFEHKDATLMKVIKENAELVEKIKAYAKQLNKESETLNLFYNFIRGKCDIQGHHIQMKSTNPNDYAFSTISKKGRYVVFDVFSFNVGSAVAHADINADGKMDIYSYGREIEDSTGKTIELKTKEYLSMGFGDIQMQRMIEYCKANNITKLEGKVMEMTSPEQLERMHKYYIKNGFEIKPDGGAGYAVQEFTKVSSFIFLLYNGF